MKGKRALVTGGAGFIGSHIAAKLADEWEVTVYDNLSTGHRENVPEAARFVQGDICDPESLSSACREVDVIFHLAAQISVPESMNDPLKTVRINTIGTLNVLKAAAKRGVRRVIFSSSAAVYGDNPVNPKCETMLPAPKSPYAVTKLDGEHYGKIWREANGLQAISLRYFNVYGPRQDPNSPYAAAIPSFIKRAVRNEELWIFGDGNQTRDFTYVDDVASANLRAATWEGSEGRDWVYNVACGKSTSINDLARLIIAAAGSKSKVVYKPQRQGDIQHSLADTTAIRQFGLDEGLRRTLSCFSEALR
jgi:UDP-glucose 4-epimerase